MTVQEAIQTQAKVTVHLGEKKMVRGRVSPQNHPNHPVLVITLPGGAATTFETAVVMDVITNKLILNW